MKSRIRSIQLCHTVTNCGHRYFIDSKRVSLEAFQLAKFGRNQSCFCTRATKDKVQNFSNVTWEVFE